MSEIEVHIPKRAFLPCYHHLLNSKSDIDFLWGGRDSGKSAHIARQLVKDCLSLPYFRCVLARKVFNTIKESQWQMIKDVATSWGVDHLFTFNTNPLEIKCINGNKFICRGMDDAANLKSISNPSHCWAEEMNQMTLDDFILIMTSLRYNSGKVKMWCSFNPEADGDFEEYWLYKSFFSSEDKNFTSTWSIEIPSVGGVPVQTVDYVYSSTHTTYHDNRYCRPERAAFLEQLAVLDPYYYKVFTLGQWGNRKNEDPFCYTFDRAKHVAPTALNRSHEVKLSFDFNVNPITCGVYQDYHPEWIYGIESIKLDNSDIYKLCDYINERYPGCLFQITGDATGRNTTALVQDGINYYTVIKSKLNLANGQIRVPTVNPKVKENRVLVNAVFHAKKVALDPVGCKGLIYDCENVSVNDMGDIDKGDRSNPKKRADHLDNFRYFLGTFHKNVLKI